MLCLHRLSFGLLDRSLAEAYCASRATRHVFHFDIDLKQLGSGLLSDLKVLLLKLSLTPQAVGKETRWHGGQGADLVDALLSFVLDGNDVA